MVMAMVMVKGAGTTMATVEGSQEAHLLRLNRTLWRN
jgi:hypothetical protein